MTIGNPMLRVPCRLALVLPILLAACAQTPVAPSPASSTAVAAAPAQQIRTAPHCAKPIWPAESLQARETGNTTLSFLIGPDGLVRASKILKSSGHDRLDEAAASALRNCRFKPAVKDGIPVEAWVAVQYRWTID
jgi:TonB family protein